MNCLLYLVIYLLYRSKILENIVFTNINKNKNLIKLLKNIDIIIYFFGAIHDVHNSSPVIYEQLILKILLF